MLYFRHQKFSFQHCSKATIRARWKNDFTLAMRHLGEVAHKGPFLTAASHLMWLGTEGQEDRLWPALQMSAYDSGNHTFVITSGDNAVQAIKQHL